MLRILRPINCDGNHVYRRYRQHLTRCSLREAGAQTGKPGPGDQAPHASPVRAGVKRGGLDGVRSGRRRRHGFRPSSCTASWIQRRRPPRPAAPGFACAQAWRQPEEVHPPARQEPLRRTPKARGRSRRLAGLSGCDRPRVGGTDGPRRRVCSPAARCRAGFQACAVRTPPSRPRRSPGSAWRSRPASASADRQTRRRPGCWPADPTGWQCSRHGSHRRNGLHRAAQ